MNSKGSIAGADDRRLVCRRSRHDRRAGRRRTEAAATHHGQMLRHRAQGRQRLRRRRRHHVRRHRRGRLSRQRLEVRSEGNVRDHQDAERHRLDRADQVVTGVRDACRRRASFLRLCKSKADMPIASRLPARAGVGFKPEHFGDILAAPQPLGFFEVHAENYMGAGGPPHAQLGALRARYALSVHGVGLSIGSMQPLDRDHLARLKILCDRYEPESFSEHLAWSSHDGVYFNDLLPLPYTWKTLDRVADHIDEVQTALGAHDAARKSFDLCSPCRKRYSGGRVPCRNIEADRLRLAARRQQCFRLGEEQRHRAAVLSGFVSARSGAGNPPWRPSRGGR